MSAVGGWAGTDIDTGAVAAAAAAADKDKDKDTDALVVVALEADLPVVVVSSPRIIVMPSFHKKNTEMTKTSTSITRYTSYGIEYQVPGTRSLTRYRTSANQKYYESDNN